MSLIFAALSIAANAQPLQTQINVPVAAGQTATVQVSFLPVQGLGRVETWLVSPGVIRENIITDCHDDAVKYGYEEYKNGAPPISHSYGPGTYTVYPMRLDACPSAHVFAAYVTLVSYTATAKSITWKYTADLGTEQATITVILEGIGGGGPIKESPERSVKHRGCCCCCGSDMGSAPAENENYPSAQAPPSDEQSGSGTGETAGLEIPRQFHPQERENWCWAAVSQTSMLLLGENHTQCEQAQRFFQPHEGDCALAANEPFRLTLDDYEFNGHNGKPRFEVETRLESATLRSILDRVHMPLPWAIDWVGRGGAYAGSHFMMIMDAEATTDGFLTVFDPWPANHGDVFMVKPSRLRRNGVAFTSNWYVYPVGG
jgi:hypothetical protein